MATPNPTHDLSLPVTRQNLFDMWADAALGDIVAADLADSVSSIFFGSDLSDAPASPKPGQLFWHRTDNLMYCWHDAIDDTGVSLWLAIGPDRLDVALLADEPIPPASPISLSHDRHGSVAEPEARPIGFSQNGMEYDVRAIAAGTATPDTAASGSWFRCAIDGICWMRIEDALSHPTGARARLAVGTLIGLDTDAARKGSVMNAGTFLDTNTLFTNPVGFTLEQAVTPTGTTVTESPHYFKAVFAPREYRAYREDFA